MTNVTMESARLPMHPASPDVPSVVPTIEATVVSWRPVGASASELVVRPVAPLDLRPGQRVGLFVDGAPLGEHGWTSPSWNDHPRGACPGGSFAVHVPTTRTSVLRGPDPKKCVVSGPFGGGLADGDGPVAVVGVGYGFAQASVVAAASAAAGRRTVLVQDGPILDPDELGRTLSRLADLGVVVRRASERPGPIRYACLMEACWRTDVYAFAPPDILADVEDAVGRTHAMLFPDACDGGTGAVH